MTGISPERIFIAQDTLMEGMILLRKGCPDLDLGERKWDMVRIYIGNSFHYIKGMAVYSEEMPDGIDVIFYTRFRPNGEFQGYGTSDEKHKHSMERIVNDNFSAWDAWANSLKQPAKRKKAKKEIVTLSEIEWKKILKGMREKKCNTI